MRKKLRFIYRYVFGKFVYNPFNKIMIDNQILFVHIPKTGGTSISTALFGKDAGHPYLYQFYFANKNYTKAFYKFCVVRNPYDRLVSTYFHFTTNTINPIIKKLWDNFKINSFEELVLKMEDPVFFIKLTSIIHFVPQHEMISYKDLQMDRIFKFENFDNVEQELNAHLKDTQISLKKLNSSKRTSYQDYYNPKTKAIVYKVYKRDFELFDYPPE